MGAQESSESRGVKCYECGVGLPPNNWEYFCIGDGGHTYAFYKEKHEYVDVLTTVGAGGSMNSEGIVGVSTGCSEVKSMRDVRVLQYIKNTYRESNDGYTCLNCLWTNCREEYPGWDEIFLELNALLRDNAIYVECKPRFSLLNGPMKFGPPK